MDITQLIALAREETAKVILIFIATTVINLVANKVFLEPFLKKWGSNISRRVVPYVINKLDPIAPEAISSLTPKELEELIFEQIINAPGSPQWIKEVPKDEPFLTQQRNKTLRKIYREVIAEYDITKAAAKTGRTLESEGDSGLQDVRRKLRRLEKRVSNNI